MQPIDGSEADNQTRGRNEEVNMPVILSGKNMNITEDVMAFIG